MVELDLLDFAFPLEFDDCRTVFRRTKRESHILVGTGETNPALQVWMTGNLFGESLWARPAVFTLDPAGFLGAFGRHRLDTDARWNGGANRKQVALVQQIPHPDFDRIHAKGFCQLVHLGLG